jgi:hypothetical protein
MAVAFVYLRRRRRSLVPLPLEDSLEDSLEVAVYLVDMKKWRSNKLKARNKLKAKNKKAGAAVYLRRRQRSPEPLLEDSLEDAVQLADTKKP